MRIQQIRISNILGIEDLELTPKGYTQISGTNGTGKTSVLEAIKAALGVGEDATLLRKGAERGEVVLVLDDGTTIRKAVSQSGARTTVKGADGKALAKPAEVIQGLADVLSVNPVDFLLAKPKERVRVLLDAMPLTADPERLTKITGIDASALAERHALEVIETVRKQVYDDRTGTNRAVKEKEATISQLRQAMPEAPGGVEGDEASLEAEIAAAAAVRDTTLKKIDAKLSGLRDEAQKKIDEIRAEAQRQIDEVKAGLDTQSQRAAAARENALKTYTDTTGPKAAALTTLRANRDAVAKRAGALETIAKLEKEAEALQADADRQTAALEALEAYKGELLQSLPIPGLEVRDGEVFRDGVPLDRLNTAQQVQIAVEVAKLRAGDLAIACVDRLESLDKDSRDELRKGAAAAGLQLFVTRVTDEPFKIATAG
jgi:DNA repair exonuclease SbcCD ATPase subunit